MSATEKQAAPYTLRILCTDANAAQLFETWLLSEGVDTSGTDGRDVLIPWGGDARFALSVGELAVLNGFAPDDLTPITRQIIMAAGAVI